MRRVRGLFLPAALLLAWQLASQGGTALAYVFVPLSEIGASLAELARSGELGLHLGATLVTAAIGLCAGSVAGLMLGTALAFSRPLEALIGPAVAALRQVPTIGLVPLIALWFGTGEFSIRLLVATAAFEVMVLNTREGLRAVEPRFVELGRALCLDRRQAFFAILLPAALPAILTGLLQAIAFVWMATIGAELLFAVGPGLGVIMERAQLAGRMDMTIACLILIAIAGYAVNAACQAARQRLLRWRNPG